MSALADLHPTHATEPTPEYEAAWLNYIRRDNAEFLGSLQRGLEQSAAGEVVDLGSFAQYADTEPFAAHVCGTCGATGDEPCRYPSGKARRLYHVKRG